MKISLDAAMRARDVSQPTAADTEAAAALAELHDRTEPPAEARADPASQGAQHGDARSRAPKRPRT